MGAFHLVLYETEGHVRENTGESGNNWEGVSRNRFYVKGTMGHITSFTRCQDM